MSYFGINSVSDNNYFAAALSSKNSNSSSDNSSLGLSSMISSSSSLGDYSLIQNGTYKKLLNAYYSKQKTGEEATENKAEKVNLSTANSDASGLNNAVNKLMNVELTDENRDTLKESLKSVVEKYNSLIDSASEVDNTSVLRQALWMTQGTSAVSKSLSDIGISIGEGNKLTLDEAKFDKAQISTMKTLFEGKDSFMGKLASRTNLISNAASNAVAGAGKASTYTNRADYTKTNSGNIVDTFF